MNAQKLIQLFNLKTGVEFSKVQNQQGWYKKNKVAIFNAYDELNTLLMLIEYADENNDEYAAIDIKEQKNEFKKALSKI